MKISHFAQISLQLRLWLTRFGWSKCIACLLFAFGSGTWLLAVPHLKTQVANRQSAHLQTQKMLDSIPLYSASPVLPQAEQRLADFYDSLGETRYAEQQVKTLFAVAAKNGLTLNQAEYKFAYDTNGRFRTYTILLPVKGPYSGIRPFCEQILLAIPFASLDEINFKRETITNPILEAKIRITLHLNDVGNELRATDSNQGVGS